MILFILTQPGIFVTIPTKNIQYFVLLHGVLFVAIYTYVKEYFTVEKEIEGFDDNEKELLEEQSHKIDKLFSDFTIKELNNKTEEEFQEIISKGMNDITQEQQKRLQKYMKYKQDNKNIDHNNEAERISLSDKLEYIFNNSSIEQIQYFDTISNERQTAFERLVDNMTMENIDKYLKLNVAKIKESVQEVAEMAE